MRLHKLSFFIVLILIFIFTLSACDTPVSLPPIKTNTASPPTSTGTGVITQSPAATVTTVITPTVKPPTATPKPISDNLDIDELDTLDNTKTGWWYNRAAAGMRPTFPSAARELCERYDGIYIGPNEKTVYLTFDLGYENGFTPTILDTLKQYDVKAIFFVTRSFVRSNGTLIQRMLNEGHQIGNHTITHPSLPTVSYEKLEHELLDFHKEFYDQYGYTFRYMRPPSGEYSARTLRAAQQIGYKSVFWSFAYLDYDTSKQKDADYAYNRIISELHPGAVYLLHGVSSMNTAALGRVIEEIKAQGYEIKSLDL